MAQGSQHRARIKKIRYSELVANSINVLQYSQFKKLKPSKLPIFILQRTHQPQKFIQFTIVRNRLSSQSHRTQQGAQKYPRYQNHAL